MPASLIDAPYTELTSRLRRLGLHESIRRLLGWDEQVNLPPGAAAQRGEQQAILAESGHNEAIDPRLGALISDLEQQGGLLTEDQRIVVRKARRDYDRESRLPAEFVRESSVQRSHGYHAWAKAKATNDFKGFAPVLEKNLELARREAAYLGYADRPYDLMIDTHDPGVTAAAIGPLFAELKAQLVPFVRSIVKSPKRTKATALRGFPIAGQRALLRSVTAQLGFDYTHGRIDESLHPFCSGTGADIRMTTRFDENKPLGSLLAAVHETGHGLYQQGLPAAHLGTALGTNAGAAVHESQSRLWENQVARSRGFWRHFEPHFRAQFPTQTAAVTSEDLYLAINSVALTPIRVGSDEVTYNLHILLRFEIEQRLFAGSLAVADLPAAWGSLSQELLGLTPENDREGILQDVHWSARFWFGYFPSYCLGNMIAAQLWYRILSERPSLEEDFARGEFGWLLGWLRENVHAQASRYDELDLVRHVTGRDLSPEPLMRYLRGRYGALYL